VNEGVVGPKLTSEGRSFEVIARSFRSFHSCFPTDPDQKYCSDGTALQGCSTLIPYRCEYVSGAISLGYEPSLCGTAPWEEYAAGCVYGKQSYCTEDAETLVKKECEYGKWITDLEQRCADENTTKGASGWGNRNICEIVNGTAQCVLQGSSCSDGTASGRCSSVPPKYCESGVLFDNPNICGCPANAQFELTTASCVYVNCADGTPLKACSQTRPQYCSDNGVLIDNASFCGCPNGDIVANDSCTRPQSSSENHTNSTARQQTNNETPPVQPPNEVSRTPTENQTPRSSGEVSDVSGASSEELICTTLMGLLVVAVAYLYFKAIKKSTN
jgi:hypothetical protein